MRTKTSLLFISIFAIVALLVLAGFTFRQRNQRVPQAQNRPPPSSQIHIESVPQPTPTTTVQYSLDLTSTWRTYRSEELRFQYKYPNDWVHEKYLSPKGPIPPTFQMSPKGNTNVIIYISVIENNIADLKKFRENLPFHGEIEQLSITGFNGFSETFAKDHLRMQGGGYWKTVFVEYGENKILEFQLTIDALASPADERLGRDTLDEIIKTLKFF